MKNEKNQLIIHVQIFKHQNSTELLKNKWRNSFSFFIFHFSLPHIHFFLLNHT